MTRLYLVRHGETVDNVNKIMQGQTHGRLTLFGIEQARQLGQELHRMGVCFDAFVSSDLARAVETCQILISELSPTAHPTTTPLLRERNWGSFTGRYIPDLQGIEWTDDIETTGQMKERARQFLRFIRQNYEGQTVLAVGHGIINKAVRSVFCGRPMNEVPKMQNCEYVVLEL